MVEEIKGKLVLPESSSYETEETGSDSPDSGSNFRRGKSFPDSRSYVSTNYSDSLTTFTTTNETANSEKRLYGAVTMSCNDGRCM